MLLIKLLRVGCVPAVLFAASGANAQGNPTPDSCRKHYDSCMSYMAKAAAKSGGRGMQGCQSRYETCMATPGQTGTYTDASGKVHSGLVKQ